MKRTARENINSLGLDFDKILTFLMSESKIDVGFEAQLIGIGAKSATTTGLIIYVLSTITEITSKEKELFIREIDHFKINDGFSDVYGTNNPCSWATMQIVLALISLGAEKDKIRTIIESAIRNYHLPSGAWCFSRQEDENLIYAIYPIIALNKAANILGADYSKEQKGAGQTKQNIIKITR